ncbi:MAG: DNA-binding transcriptional LysR family regulator [Gammaproteobacteria bacterium]|jgi:DNA-binding transcriptional LysR family regulator
MQRYYYKQNRLKQLRAFCSTARSQSMSKAAEQMFLSQPSISLLIQALEKDLETHLFDRLGPKLQLTNEGKILLELALPMVEGLEGLPETFHDRCHNTVTGSLNIAAGESTTLYLLPKIVERFTQQYPQIQVKLHNVPGRQGLSMVRRGDVDLAVGPMTEIPDEIWYSPLVSYEPVLITPQGHPLASQKKVSLQDIAPYGLILPPHSMSTRNYIDVVFQQHNFEYRVSMEAGGWEVIKKYVELDLGISIVTSICLTGKEKLARIPLSEYFPLRSYGLVLRRGKFISPATRKFIELLDVNALDNFYQGTFNIDKQSHIE